MALELAPATRLRRTRPMTRGRIVRQLQLGLIRLGLLPIGADDGLFGQDTERAVLAYQRKMGLAVTGVVEGDQFAALTGSGKPAPSPRARSGDLLLAKDLPPANPKRVILHWTGGGRTASAEERALYHFLIEQSGRVVRGKHPVNANDARITGAYAAHTLNKNTGSIGVSLCGMFRANERPFRPGPAPIVKSQLPVLARLVAQLCHHYGIPVSRKTVLGHGEVQDLLGVAQEEKWDPLVLPWAPHRQSFREVGDMLRAMVRAALELRLNPEIEEPEPALMNVVFEGKTVADAAFFHDTATWLRLDILRAALDWPDPAPGEPRVYQIPSDGEPVPVTVQQLELGPSDHRPDCARLSDLAEMLELVPQFSDGNGVLTLASAPAQPAAATQETRRILVRRGDSLSRIARRELGDASRYDALLGPDGLPYYRARGDVIHPGDVLYVPLQGDQAERDRASAGFEIGDIDTAAAAIADASHHLNRIAANDAAKRILKECAEQGVSDLSHIAYILATAHHETNFGRSMVEAWTPSKAQLRYASNGSNKLNRPLPTGVTPENIGKHFLGRGYVQLTFWENYLKFSDALGHQLESNPALAAEPDIAAEILVAGMSRVGYRHKRLVLKYYGYNGSFDFIGAREIVNADRDHWEPRYGMTRGAYIGQLAERFRAALDPQGELGSVL